MKTILQIDGEMQAKASIAFKEFGTVFAFSDKQFKEQKEEGVTYICVYTGVLVPEDNVQSFNERFDALHNEKKNEFVAHVPMDEYINYELCNHECFYTGDYSEVMELVQPYYLQCTNEDVRRVYLANIDKHD